MGAGPRFELPFLAALRGEQSLADIGCTGDRVAFAGEGNHSDLAGIPVVAVAHEHVTLSNKALERNGRGGVVIAFFHSGVLVCFGDVSLSARPSAISLAL